MRKLNFFKKLRLFFEYRKLLSPIEKELELNMNARVDRVSRIYTVINIPTDVVEEPYNFRKSDIDALAQNFIKQYTSEMGQFLNQKGLSEFCKFYDVRKVDKYSYLLVFGFSLFDSRNVALRFIYTFLILISVITILIIK